MKPTIEGWLNSGAEVQQGLRLLSIHQPNKSLEALVVAQPARYKHLVRQNLCALAGITKAQPKREYPKFREQWSFLSRPNCPSELKILAADKITAYTNFAKAHDELYGCTTPRQCFEVAERAVKSYLENHAIYKEFIYYKEHASTLGEHSIFKESAEVDKIKKMTIIVLIKRQQQLENNIWRAESEIQKGTKPYLDIERQQRLERTKEKLSIVNRYIKDHEQATKV